MAKAKTAKAVKAAKVPETVYISEADQYLFAQGTHYDIYKKLGAHQSVEDGKKGMSFAAAKLAQYRETLERTDYSDVWERSKKLKLPFFCQLPKDIGNLSSGELAEYTKKVLDADEQGGV